MSRHNGAKEQIHSPRTLGCTSEYARGEADVQLPPPAHESEDDVALMQAIAGGDEQAFERLYDRYAARVHAVGVRVLGNSADAEEATLDTFWEVWQKARRYDPKRGRVISYLLMLSRSRALDRRRARGSRAGSTCRLSGGEDAQQDVRYDSPAQPVEHALLNEQRGKVVEGLRRLKNPQREAIELAFFEGLTHREIAEELTQPLGTVKTRIRQGLICLRELLQSPSEEGDTTP